MIPVFELTVLDLIGGLSLIALWVGLVSYTRCADAWARPLMLTRMISRVGGKLDAASDPFLGERLASAARLCAGCRSYGECRQLLAHSADDDVPDFCPNRYWIRSLAGAA